MNLTKLKQKEAQEVIAQKKKEYKKKELTTVQTQIMQPIVEDAKLMGKRLEYYRITARYTLNDVAEKSGLTISTIRRAELGSHVTTFATLARILSVLTPKTKISSVLRPIKDDLGNELERGAVGRRVRGFKERYPKS